MTDCYDRASSTAAYALGALPPEEVAEFEAALAESPQLRAEVEGFAQTAALLGLAAPSVEPSAALKASVLAAIDAQARAESPSLPREASPLADRDAALASGDHVARRPAPSRVRTRALRALVGAATAVALFAAGALAGGLVTAVSEQRTADQFAALNAAPDLIRTETELPEGGSISFVASEELGMSAVVLHDAELPEDRTFQAWYVKDSGPESAGVVEPAGDGTVYRMLDREWDGETVAMTIEPAGGSPEPTTEPMVLTEAAEVS